MAIIEANFFLLGGSGSIFRRGTLETAPGGTTPTSRGRWGWRAVARSSPPFSAPCSPSKPSLEAWSFHSSPPTRARPLVQQNYNPIRYIWDCCAKCIVPEQTMCSKILNFSKIEFFETYSGYFEIRFFLRHKKKHCTPG